MKKWVLLICALAIQVASSSPRPAKAKAYLQTPDEIDLNSLDLYQEIQLRKAITQDLPLFKSVFKHYAREFNLDWLFVAAVAYQESKWNSEAVSYTGVRGMMMLTEDTAQYLGVNDRADLHQSVWGGAKYLRKLMNAQPKHLSKKQRKILALIAYNIGYGHLKDAQRLAVQYGLNPYKWKDLRKVLPLLSDPSVFVRLEYGAARGYEAVQFVERVLSYYQFLSQPKKQTLLTRR